MWALSAGVKGPASEADHSSLSNSEIKNVGAIPPLSRKSSFLNSRELRYNLQRGTPIMEPYPTDMSLNKIHNIAAYFVRFNFNIKFLYP
jgi:hypothetical protein